MLPPFLSSWFSNKKKSSGAHKHRHLDNGGDINGQPPPSSTVDPIVNSTIKVQRETVVDREPLGDQVKWIDNDDGGQGQPPSVSGIRPVAVSQPSGGNQMSTAADLPPSLNDVGRRGGSLTGDLVAGKGPVADDEQDLAGMSLVGNKFKEFFPVPDGR